MFYLQLKTTREKSDLKLVLKTYLMQGTKKVNINLSNWSSSFPRTGKIYSLAVCSLFGEVLNGDEGGWSAAKYCRDAPISAWASAHTLPGVQTIHLRGFIS